jgi:hypothetical protein
LFRAIKDKLLGKSPNGAKRSSHWPSIRRAHLLESPFCRVCLGWKSVEVHHIQPFHVKPDLELDPSNLVTLCESKKSGVNCHLWFGHLGNYRLCNQNVVEDADHWRIKRT